MSATQVWERLFIGGIGDAEALAESNPFGITTVVTLCEEEVQKRAAGVNYLHIPLREDWSLPIGKFDEIIDSLWENIRWGKVLVHSFDGADRAPIVGQSRGCI